MTKLQGGIIIMKNYKGNLQNYELLKEMVSQLNGRIIEPRETYGPYACLIIQVKGVKQSYSPYSGIESAILDIGLNPKNSFKEETKEKIRKTISIMSSNGNLDEVKAFEMLYDENISMYEIYEEGIGNIDSVNSRETIEMYISDMIPKGISVSHMLVVLENSNADLFSVWLGNSMETPTPITTKRELIEALGFI